MTTGTASSYKSQLPKLEKLSALVVFGIIGTIASVVSLVMAFIIPKEHHAAVLAYYLAILNLLLFAYIVYVERRRSHRYPESMLFLHYVNHVIRDYLAGFDGHPRAANDLLTDILDATSECFSILTGVKCRASIKELRQDKTIATVARNSTSLPTPGTRNTHSLDENTDFYNLWYSLEGCSRFFLCNNLLRAFAVDGYRNSSFKEVGLPKKWGVGAFTVVIGWKLPYRSTLVLPIRYVGDFAPPDASAQDKVTPESWDFWGFLCIDASRRSVFDSRYMPELGAAIADSLYTLLGQIHRQNPERQDNGQKRRARSKKN